MKGRVLVVEDDDTIREVIRAALTYEGYELATAADGVAALELLTGWLPDLILLDLRMPRMDGVTFADTYRRLPGPHAPIVLLTAAQEAHPLRLKVAADAELNKPFDLGELIELVDKVIGARQTPPASAQAHRSPDAV